MCWVHIRHSELWVDLAPHLLHVTAQAEANLMACCTVNNTNHLMKHASNNAFKHFAWALYQQSIPHVQALELSIDSFA